MTSTSRLIDDKRQVLPESEGGLVLNFDGSPYEVQDGAVKIIAGGVNCIARDFYVAKKRDHVLHNSGIPTLTGKVIRNTGENIQ